VSVLRLIDLALCVMVVGKGVGQSVIKLELVGAEVLENFRHELPELQPLQDVPFR
jgi:hypothetical protein